LFPTQNLEVSFVKQIPFPVHGKKFPEIGGGRSWCRVEWRW